MPVSRRLIAGFAALTIMPAASEAVAAQTAPASSSYLISDSHLHLTDYIQEGADAGNSVKAQKVIAEISNALGGNPYAT